MDTITIGSTWVLIKESSPEHLCFHLNSFPSPYVVIRCSDPGPDIIAEAASVCKSKSKYSHLKNMRVLYTQVSNMKLDHENGTINIISMEKCNYVTPP